MKIRSILSIILTVAVILGTVAAIPVSAEAPTYSLPYLFTDFEDGYVNIFDGNYSPAHEIADTGFGGSSKSAKLTATDEQQYPGWQIGRGTSTFTASAGSVLTASFWIKLEKPWATNSVQLFVPNKIGTATSDTNTALTPATALDKTSTEWQKLTFKHKVTAETTFTGWMELRMYENTLATVPEGQTYGERVVYIDDFEMKILAPGVDRGYTYDQQAYDDYNLDFETGTTHDHLVNYQSNPYGTIVAEPGNTSNHVLEIIKSVEPTDGRDAYLAKNGNRTNVGSLNPGETVEISMDVKLQKRMTVTDVGASNIRIFMTDTNHVAYSNSLDSNNTTDWQTLKMSYTNNSEETFQDTFTKFEMYFWQRLRADETTADSDVIFYLDNIKSRIIRTGEVHPTIDNLSATRDRAGVVTPTYTYREAATTETTGTDASYYKLINAEGAVVASGSVAFGIKIPEAYKKADLKLEIIPVSSNKLVGEKVTVISAKPALYDIKIVNFEDGDDLDVAGATVTNSGSEGTKGLSVTADSVTISTVIDPGFSYKVSAKLKATVTPTASFAMSDGTTFTNSAMAVTALGDNWYSLTLDDYNFNTANSTSYMATQIVADAKITFGASGSYVLDDITFMPVEMTEIAGVTVTLPQSAQIFDTVNATVSEEASMFYVFEISADGTNWTTVDTGITSKATIPYFMDAVVADKKLRVTIYTDGVSYEYKTSNVLTENTQSVVATEIKITNSLGVEVEDVTDGFLTATATVYNPSETPANITLYNAVYSTVPFKLAYLNPMAVTAPKGITVVTDTVDLTDVSHYSEYTHCLKTFLWNGYTPLTDAVVTQAAELIDGAVYNMYIDPSIQTVEGIVLANRHGESGAYTESSTFRAFCKERNLAIFNFYDGSNGELKWFHNEEFAMNVLNTKIAEFAQTTGHPELNYVPIATLGHSNGCYAAAKIAQLNPERTFAVLAFKAAYGSQFEYDEIIEAGIPVFAITGENDWSWGYHDQIHSAERMVAQDAIVTYVQQPDAGHGNMASAEDIILAFLDEAYKAKVQNATVSNGKVIMNEIDVESGYIGYGDYTEEVKSVWIAENSRNEDITVYEFANPRYMTYAEYKTKPADFKVQAWLFNESFAQKWTNFISTGSID